MSHYQAIPLPRSKKTIHSKLWQRKIYRLYSCDVQIANMLHPLETIQRIVPLKDIVFVLLNATDVDVDIIKINNLHDYETQEKFN